MQNISTTFENKLDSLSLNHDFVSHASNITPTVRFSFDGHYLVMKGNSSLQDPEVFYSKINKVLDHYMQSGNSELKVYLKFEYLNPSSIKCLKEMMRRLELMRVLVKDISINWYYDKEDDLMLEYGRNFVSAFPKQINLVAG